MTATVTRAERLLNSIANNKTFELTHTGKDFLIANLDPFHDTQLKELQGWPDVEVGSSIVRCVKKSMQLSATSGGGSPPTAPWDLHIAMIPVLDSFTYVNSSARTGTGLYWNSATQSTTANFGGLVARAQFNTGQPVNWMPTPGFSTELGNLPLDPQFSNGLGRLIGVGFEVHDVTAAISRQGTCTTYCQSEPRMNGNTFSLRRTDPPANTWDQSDLSLCTLHLPPTTITDAMLYPGSRQWKAEEGCYLVGRFHSNENPPVFPTGTCPFWVPADNEEISGNDLSNGWYPNQVYVEHLVVGATTFSKRYFPSTKIYPFHNFGCILSGLNPLSTFTVNVNYYYESFPNISDKDILVLATPSAEYDPMALNILSHTLSRMPVAVKVKENFLGGWFDGIVKEILPYAKAAGDIATVAAPIVGALHPGAGLALGATGKAINYMTTPANSFSPKGKPIIAPPKKKRKKTKNKNNKLAAGNRGKKGKIQGPLRQ